MKDFKKLREMVDLQVKAYAMQMKNIYKQAKIVSKYTGVDPLTRKRVFSLTDPVKPAGSFLEDAMNMVDSNLSLNNKAHVDKLLAHLDGVVTEADRMALLIVFRSTLSKQAIIGRQLTEQFHKRSGLKVIHAWIKEAKECGQIDLLLMLLTIVGEIPYKLDSIAASKISDTLKVFKKNAPNDKVQEKSSEILKMWRRKLEAEKEEEAVAAKRLKTETANDKKKSEIAAAKKSERSDVLGKLLQRGPAKPGSKKLPTKTPKSKPVISQTAAAAAVPALPEIHRFGQHNDKNSPRNRKIRWADEVDNGKLTHVKLIESRHEMAEATMGHSHKDFRDAIRREHENERDLIAREKEVSAQQRVSEIVAAGHWKPPKLATIPESLLSIRRTPTPTPEVQKEASRTSQLMEFVLLASEEPPKSAEEWLRPAGVAFVPSVNIPPNLAGEEDVIPTVQYDISNDRPPVQAVADNSEVKELRKALPESMKSLSSHTINALAENLDVAPIIIEQASKRPVSNEMVLKMIADLKSPKDQSSQPGKSDEICFFYDKFPGCKRGANCQFRHSDSLGVAPGKKSKAPSNRQRFNASTNRRNY